MLVISSQGRSRRQRLPVARVRPYCLRNASKGIRGLGVFVSIGLGFHGGLVVSQRIPQRRNRPSPFLFRLAVFWILGGTLPTLVGLLGSDCWLWWRQFVRERPPFPSKYESLLPIRVFALLPCVPMCTNCARVSTREFGCFYISCAPLFPQVRTKQHTTSIKVRIDELTKVKLAAEAKVQGLDLSDVVRRAIALYFATRIRAL
jgi:hypothetical protein